MINTYNESSLHKTLKILIAEEHASKTEVKLDGYICDVVTFYTSMKRGDFCDVFEIQTQNLGKLLSKITHLQKKHNVCLVHPISIETYIETYSENGEKLSCRKSPKKKDVYNLFDELTGIWSLINTCKNNKNSNVLGHFKLEIVETKIIKIKIKTKEPVQLTNKS
ncbi:MAG TPA: hypothetical protein VFC68_06210, partial [Treponemataceae bacterium]|nr:hypothetical protein [Treponemataceae bacterium]